MATSMKTSSFAGQRVFTASPCRHQHIRRLPISCAHRERREVPGRIQQLAIGLAAAALVHTAPAEAGLIIERPQLKKVFQSEPVERVKKEAANVGAKVSGGGSAPSLPKPNLPSLGISTSLLTLPLAIGGIGVGTLLWKQIDPSFSSFFDDALAKNNNKIGAGYEQAVNNMARGASRSAPKKAAKAAKSGTKKIGGFFGKKA